jgi:hypothetical protein
VEVSRIGNSLAESLRAVAELRGEVITQNQVIAGLQQQITFLRSIGLANANATLHPSAVAHTPVPRRSVRDNIEVTAPSARAPINPFAFKQQVRAALVSLFRVAGPIADNEAVMGANYLIAHHYQQPSNIDADPQQVAQELWNDVGADRIMEIIAPTTAARPSRSTSPSRAAKPVVPSHPPGFPSEGYLHELHEALASQLKVLPTNSTHDVVADHTAANIIRRRVLPDPFKYSSNAAVTAVVLMDHCKESIREVLEAFQTAFANGDQTYNSKFERK